MGEIIEGIISMIIIILFYFISIGCYSAGLKEGYRKAYKELTKD